MLCRPGGYGARDCDLYGGLFQRDLHFDVHAECVIRCCSFSHDNNGSTANNNYAVRIAAPYYRLCLNFSPGGWPSDNLLVILCWLCRHQQGFERQDCLGLRWRSCLPHRVSEDGQRVLDRLGTVPNMIKESHSQSTRTVLVGPKHPNLPRRSKSSAPSTFRTIFTLRKSLRTIFPSSFIVQAQNDKVLRDTLGIFFMTECLVTTAYLETFVPFILLQLHARDGSFPECPISH